MPNNTTPLLVQIPEACRLIGLGRSKLYEMIGAGQIEIVKIGGRTLVPHDALVSLVEKARKQAG